MIVLNGETENTQVDCLVDTGASANYISEAVYKTLDHNSIDSEMVWRAYEGNIKIADGTLVKSLGVVTLNLFVIDRVISVSLIIIKDLSYDIILGLEFLKDNDVDIHLSRDNNGDGTTICFKNKNTEFPFKNKNTE